MVVYGPGGSFILELPMGVLTALLPPEEEWERRAPEWACALWPVLKRELEDWCRENDAQFHIQPSAGIFPLR